MSGSLKRAIAVVAWWGLGSAAMAAGLPACAGQADDGTVVSDSAYVDIMVHLMLLRDSLDAIDLPYWSQQQVLDSVEVALSEQRGVTADDLFEFARTVGRDPLRMQELWTLIEARIDSIRPPEEDGEPGTDGRDRTGRDRRFPADRPGSRRVGG